VTGSEAPAGWVDSHCHVYDTRLDGGPDGAVAAARAAGVGTMIAVGCDRESSLAAIEIAERHPGVFPTVGLHPHDAKQGLGTILDLLDHAAVVAVGEAGLDFYYDHSPRDVQREVFAAQIGIAHQRDLTLVIHTRDAWEETFAVLDTEGTPTRTVFHCFTGGPAEAAQCLRRGAFISFSGIVTFPSAPEVQEAARQCPLERMLIETDSPYLAPIPHRGTRNQPAYVVHVGTFVADLRDLPVDVVRQATADAALLAFPRIGS
jgi:TatD DNase family protein